MQRVTIYSDGACSGNPGPGGWGAILDCHEPKARKEISGADPHTTNNRMELSGIIEALRLLRRPCEITIVTDSTYVADAFRKGWLAKWQKNGWRTSTKAPVKNEDLWRQMIELTDPHQIEWKWIKGHAGHPENERCDELAVQAREAVAKSRR